MNQVWKLFFQVVHHFGQGDHLLDVHGVLLLVHINILKLSISILDTTVDNPEELFFILVKIFSSDIAKLSILSNLVGRSCTHWASIDINNGFLAHIQPDDLSVLGVDGSTDLFQGSLESGNCWLTTAIDLVTRHSSKVWNSINFIWKFLDLLKVVGHGHSLPYLGVGVLLLPRHGEDVETVLHSLPC